LSIPATQIRKGMILEVDGGLFKVHEFTHVTPGKGQAVYRLKCKNLLRGNVVDRTYRTGDRIDAACGQLRRSAAPVTSSAAPADGD